jgi:hypothetical protein
MESWSLTGLPQIGVSALTTVTGASNLVQGSNYWLAILPGAADTLDGWYLNPTNAVANLYLDTGSGYSYTGPQIVGAFDVISNAPEPATFGLTAFVLAILLIARRRIATLLG